MAFTLLFPGKLWEFPGNPFTTDTPYGRPRTVSTGNVFEERDILEDALTEIAGGGIADVEDFAQAALDRANSLDRAS